MLVAVLAGGLMSNTSNWQKEKLKLKLQAGLQKPERPRFGEEAALERNAFEMEAATPNPDNATIGLLNDLQESWRTGRKGGAGDALIAGIKAGITRKSLLDDKKRLGKYMEGLDKLKSMVADTNQRLYQEQKLDDARRSIEPRVAAYLERAQSMSPDARAAYIQKAMNDYNQLAGTDYRVASVDGAEPWNIVAISGEEPVPINLMDFIKNDPQRQLDVYLNSPEIKGMEQELKRDDNLNREAVYSNNALRNAKLGQIDRESQRMDEAKRLEQETFERTGDRVSALDKYNTSTYNIQLKKVYEGIDAGNAAAKALRDVERLKEIVGKLPNLYNSLDLLILNARSENPSPLNTLLSKKIKKEDMALYQEANKLLTDLYTTELKTIPARGINQYLERQVRKKIPDLGVVPEAFNRVLAPIEDNLRHVYNDGRKYSNYFQNELIYKPQVKSLDSFAENPKNQEQSLGGADNIILEVDGKARSVPKDRAPELMKALEERGIPFTRLE